MPAIRVNSDEAAQQRQQEHEVDSDQRHEAEQHGEEAGRRALRLPAPEARLCPQLARQPHGVAQCLGDLRFAAARRHAVGEVGGVVSDEIVDFRFRQSRQAASQRFEEFEPGHLTPPAIFAAGAATFASDSTLATDSVKTFHSAFCAARPASAGLGELVVLAQRAAARFRE